MFSLPDLTVGRSPAGDVDNLEDVADGGGEGDALVVGDDDYGGVEGSEGGESFESAYESTLVVLLLLLLLPRGKSFPYWSRNWQRVWRWTNYLLLRSVFSAPKLCGGAVDAAVGSAAADNDAGRCHWRKRLRLLCHGKYCNNWRWQRPRSRGSAGESCGTGNEDTIELRSNSRWMLDLLCFN